MGFASTLTKMTEKRNKGVGTTVFWFRVPSLISKTDEQVEEIYQKIMRLPEGDVKQNAIK